MTSVSVNDRGLSSRWGKDSVNIQRTGRDRLQSDGRIMSDIRYFDVVIDGKNVQDEVFPLLQALRPDWTKDELRQQNYSDGFVNMMRCFYQQTDAKRQDAL